MSEEKAIERKDGVTNCIGVKVAYVYWLKCPDTGSVRYVGKTWHPVRRYEQHCQKTADKPTPSQQWVNSLLEQGKRPLMDVIAKVTMKPWNTIEEGSTCYLCDSGLAATAVEKQVIHQIRRRDTSLLNVYPIAKAK